MKLFSGLSVKKDIKGIIIPKLNISNIDPTKTKITIKNINLRIHKSN